MTEQEINSLDWQVISDLVLNEEIRGDVFETFSEMDFELREARIVFEKSKELEKSCKPVNIITLSDSLRAFVSPLDITRLMELDKGGAYAAQDHIQRLKERTNRKKLVTHLKKLSAELKKDTSTEKIIADTYTAFDEIQRVNQFKIEKLGDSANEYYDEIITRHQKGKKITGWLTGFTLLDTYMSGINPGNLILVAGRTSHGKTSLALQIAYSVASQGVPVIYYSMEMTRNQIYNRYVSILGGIDHFQATNAYYSTDASKNTLREVLNKLQAVPLYFDFSPSISCGQVQNAIRKMKAQTGKQEVMVITDTIQKMKHEKGENMAIRIGETSKVAEQIAKRYRAAWLMVCQLNRKPETEDRAPLLSDLKDSGSLEENADSVIIPYRHGRDTTEAELILAKNRGGDCGTRNMIFRGKYVRYEEMS